MENKAVKKYLSRLRRALTCSGPDRERLIAQGRALLEGFGEENPDPSYEDLSAAFGQPKEFAAEMLSQLPSAEVERARRRRRYMRWGTAAVLVLALGLLSALWYSKYKKSQSWNDNAIIIIQPVETMTEEEYQQYWSNIQEGAETP